MRLPIASVVLLAACSDTEPMPEFTTDCTGAEAFRIGLGVTTEAGLEITIDDAVPAPVDVGDNDWTLSIRQADGAPATGLEPVVRPWMPLHGHGVFPETYAATEESDGSYTFETFDLIMPGLWELNVELPDGDVGLFSLCAEG